MVTLFAAAGLAAGALAGVQREATDSVFPRGDPDDRIAVVGIDERSLDEVGVSWPWPRDLHAELIRHITDAGARVVAVDLVYSPPAAGDDALATALAEAPAVLAQAVDLGQVGSAGAWEIDAAVEPAPPLADAAVAVAHTAVWPDPGDGVVRTMPLVADDGVQFVPAFSLAALALTEGADAVPTLRPGAVQVGNRVVPTDDRYGLTVNYTTLGAEGAPPVISAIDVLNNKVDAAALRGKTVFVGATAPTLGDRLLTPIDSGRGQAGVLVHANAFDTMLTRSYLDVAGDRTTLLWVFLVALAVALAVQFLPLWASPLAALGIGAGFVAYAFGRSDRGTVLDVVYPVIAVVLAFALGAVARYLLEVRQRRTVSRLFSQYVPDAVAERLLDEGHAKAHAAGERLEITVLFCDLRGYTAMSAGLPPDRVAHAVDVYYAFTTEILFEEGGTLMQFVGDEVFAVFGAPLPRADHASAALRCARRFQEERPQLLEALAREGLPELKYGIGLNAGEVVAAHMGTHRHKQYSVVGDTVNVGARLCSQALAGEVVLSDAVYRRCDPAPEVIPAGDLVMKGVQEGFVAWRLVLAPDANVAVRD